MPENDQMVVVRQLGNELRALAQVIAHPTPLTPGDRIRWSAGQKAWFLSDHIGRHKVTVVTGEFTGHEAVPGELCLEVSFDDDEKRSPGCVRASSLRLRGEAVTVEQEQEVVGTYQQRLRDAQTLLVGRWPHRTGPLLTSELEKIIAAMMVDYAVQCELRGGEG